MAPGTLAAGKKNGSTAVVHVKPRPSFGLPAQIRFSSRLTRPAQIRSRSRRPDGLLGMIAFVVAIEVAFSHFGPRDLCRSHVSLSWRNSSAAIADPRTRADILCFGDSMIKLGVLPRVIEDYVGLSTYNLAVLAGQPATSYFLFRQMLESGHRPRAVIVDFSAPLLTMALHSNVECWSELASGRDAIELAIEAGDPSLCIAAMSRWLVPSRFAGRGLCRSLANGASVGHDRQSDSVRMGRVFERNWRQNRGAQVAPREYVPIAGALAEPPKPGEYRWRPRNVHTAYVVRFLSLARSHGIPVYWVLPPVVQARRNRIDSSGITAAYDVFVSSFLSNYPGVTILDGQNLEWDNRAFRDPIHLNRDGAVAFSLSIARELSRRLGAGEPAHLPRWVPLAAPQEVSALPWESLLEDLDQSREAVDRRRTVTTTS